MPGRLQVWRGEQDLLRSAPSSAFGSGNLQRENLGSKKTSVSLSMARLQSGGAQQVSLPAQPLQADRPVREAPQMSPASQSWPHFPSADSVCLGGSEGPGTASSSLRPSPAGAQSGQAGPHISKSCGVSNSWHSGEGGFLLIGQDFLPKPNVSRCPSFPSLQLLRRHPSPQLKPAPPPCLPKSPLPFWYPKPKSLTSCHPHVNSSPHHYPTLS